MSAAAQPPADYSLPGEKTTAHRRRELVLARALGVGTGIFMLLWGPLSLMRWLGTGPAWSTFEAGFLIFYGLLLVFPYSLLHSPKMWRRMMFLMLAASVVFVFVLVFDVLYVAKLYVDNADPAAVLAGVPPAALYGNADDHGPPIPMPVLNCALVFLALMQVPVVYFLRHPDKMD